MGAASRPVPEPPCYAPPIEDYALIGDCMTAALVSRHGSIDWLCLPRFDSEACFAALLGTPEHGRFRIAPPVPFSSSRRYRPNTMILETEFSAPEGRARLIDFMPVNRGPGSSIVRIVEGLGGALPMRLDFAIRFDYGDTIPWVTQLESSNGICAIAGPHQVGLRTSAELKGEGMATVSAFTLAPGERMVFVLQHAPSHLSPPPPLDAATELARTEAFWTEWASRCGYDGPFADAVMRSILTLKALTYAPTGGIVAAPTTSLPEKLGGTRNWDYRFCWLRDATITLLAMMHAGYQEEAAAWRNWLHRSVAGSPDQIRIMYGLAGERRLAEWAVDWLPGYQGAAPVRIGNAASDQLQLDVYGEMMDSLYQARKGGLASPDDGWDLQTALMLHLETIWNEPDEGIWEVRGGRRQFTSSKVAAWIAFDRAIRSIEEFGLEGPLDRWRAVRAEIHRDVCKKGFNPDLNAFVQVYGGDSLDASLLLIPLVGFLPPEDPRVRGTVAAIERDLLQDGFVARYRTEESADGLPPGEGAFLACSFWLADAYVMQGRMDDARALFTRLLSLCNDVGLLSEEYSPSEQRMTGNFPQAFSHFALVNTAFNLADHTRPARRAEDGPT